MEPQQGLRDARLARARRRAWLGNAAAVLFVLAVGGLAALMLSQQLRQDRWDREAHDGFDARAFPSTEPPVARSADGPPTVADAGGGKAGVPGLGFDAADRRLAEAAGGILVLALCVTLIRRAFPPRERRGEAQEKWARVPWRSPVEAASPPRLSSKRRPRSGAVAAERLSTVVWSDHVARQEDRRTA